MLTLARDLAVAPQAAPSRSSVWAGDPELVTMKAVRLLQSADVVLDDDLAPDVILDLARREADRIAVGSAATASPATRKTFRS